MSKRIAPEEVALVIALMLRRSGKTRARLSQKTMLRISNRQVLQTGFIEKVTLELLELKILMGVLERGGFGISSLEALSGAPAISAQKYLTKDEIRTIKRNHIDYDEWFEEACPDPEEPEDEEGEED